MLRGRKSIFLAFKTFVSELSWKIGNVLSTLCSHESNTDIEAPSVMLVSFVCQTTL